MSTTQFVEKTESVTSNNYVCTKYLILQNKINLDTDYSICYWLENAILKLLVYGTANSQLDDINIWDLILFFNTFASFTDIRH